MVLLERDEQLRRLNEALASAVQGRGRVVAIAGEGGAGKTSLVERFAASQAGRVRLYQGACEHLSTPEPLLPLRDIARASAGAFTFDPDGDHIASFEALLSLLAGKQLPCVLVLEDVHWADAATLDLIRYVGRRIARLRALLILTFREEEAGARSPLRGVLGEAPAGSVERIVLEPLSLLATTRLSETAGRRGEEIFALTGGNPFLVTEALAVVGEEPTDAVRDSTLARAARLPAEAQVVLEAVSVFPRRAEIVLVKALVEGAIEAGLDACLEKGMLIFEGDALRFRHEIARRAIEASLAPTRRRSLHQRVVDALKQRPGMRASELAHHAERAGDITALVEFARRAGEQAAQAGAHREAAAHYAMMLKHRDTLAVDEIVVALEYHAAQAYLMGAAATAMDSMGEAAQLRRKAGDAIALGRDLTRLTRFAWVCGRRLEAERYIGEAIEVLRAAGAGAELAWAYSHQSQLDIGSNSLDACITWGERAVELAEGLGEQEIVVHALNNIGTAQVQLFGPDAGATLARSLELARAGGYHDHAERAWGNLACTSYWRRDYGTALAQIEDGVSYAAEHDLAHWEVYLRGWRAMTRLDLGDWAGAETEAEEIFAWTNTPSVLRFPALITLVRLRIRRGDADADAPLETARRLAAPLRELQRSVYVAVADAERAWLASGGIWPRASASALIPAPDGVEDAVSNLRDVHLRAVEKDAHWIVELSALWLSLLGEPIASSTRLSPLIRDHCEGRWQSAAAEWRALGCPYEEAIALSLGDEEAQRQALAIFDRLAAAPAAALLRRRMRAGGMRAIPRGPISGTRANPAGLTRRQGQVLTLIGDGLSNAEIADRLCISAKTAEHHVSAVMARLDASTRRQAAASARQRGLIDLPKDRGHNSLN